MSDLCYLDMKITTHYNYWIIEIMFKNLPLVYNFSLCCTDVIAPNTDNLFTRDLMFDAVPNSSANILLTRDI